MWPHRWLTPVSRFDHAVASPSPTLTPTSRQPTSPGPRVTASRSRSAGATAALSRARSRRCGRRSRWSRAASSGTTPPNSRCRSTWEWMTLERMVRPSSTTATDVSSQDVSMPRVSANPDRPSGASRHLPVNGEESFLLLFCQVAAQSADLGVDPLQVPLVRLAKTRRVDRVRPHDDRVLAVVGVVALAAPDDLEPEVLVHLHRVVVRRPDLEGHPLGAHVVGGLDEAREDDASVPSVLEVLADADRRHVRLVVHAPHAAVADDRRVEVGAAIRGRSLDRPFLPQYDVVRARA